jgi:hypothetical protein
MLIKSMMIFRAIFCKVKFSFFFLALLNHLQFSKRLVFSDYMYSCLISGMRDLSGADE